MLKQVHALAKAGRVHLSRHLQIDHMKPVAAGGRSVTREDIYHALQNAHACRMQDVASSKWNVFGPDVDGDEMTLVCVIRGGILVVTVW